MKLKIWVELKQSTTSYSLKDRMVRYKCQWSKIYWFLKRNKWCTLEVKIRTKGQRVLECLKIMLKPRWTKYFSTFMKKTKLEISQKPQWLAMVRILMIKSSIKNTRSFQLWITTDIEAITNRALKDYLLYQTSVLMYFQKTSTTQ